MKKTIFFLASTLFAAAAFAQVKESKRLRRDTDDRVYQEVTIVARQYIVDTMQLVNKIKRWEAERDTLESFIKSAKKDLKDMRDLSKIPKDNKAAPNNAPRSDEEAPSRLIPQNPAANLPSENAPKKTRKKKKE